MDRPWHNDQLGVNKIGRNIKKSPLHQPNFSNGIGIASARPQQLASSPSRESLPHPPQNPLKPRQNPRLQKIRQAALTQMNRPQVPPQFMAQPSNELVTRQPMRPSMNHGSQPMKGNGEQLLSNTAESPVSVYVRYLQSSLGDSGPYGNQAQPPHEYQPQPQAHPLPPQSHNHHSPRFNGSARDKPILPTPRFNSPPQQMRNNSIPSPRFNGRGILPSPRSEYRLQSPTDFQNFHSPRSPYPLLSPGVQYPPPLTPRGSTFSSMDQPGILGPGTIPQPPASPGLVFPSSPYGLLPISSLRYR
ncbi:hypothetical protein CARUB_v10011012mg [Capsella rubella]|uniref:Uncharacterized protein n=1 Tax=Capsella rubella TaxID=81985 RepID=R0GL03_9BRAS|nr:protein HAIKU1 [Capsella rubella]EOA36451.1 hypothetical protein CARUB_v10011012mg [Capsella rubella]